MAGLKLLEGNTAWQKTCHAATRINEFINKRNLSKALGFRHRSDESKLGNWQISPKEMAEIQIENLPTF